MADSNRDAHRQLGIAEHEVGRHAFRLADDVDARETLHDLLPQDAQLHLRDAVAHAAVDAETERDVMARTLAVDDELVRPLDRFLVAIAGDVPHDDAVALPDLVTFEINVLESSAAHVRERRLPAD